MSSGDKYGTRRDTSRTPLKLLPAEICHRYNYDMAQMLNITGQSRDEKMRKMRKYAKYYRLVLIDSSIHITEKLKELVYIVKTFLKVILHSCKYYYTYYIILHWLTEPWLLPLCSTLMSILDILGPSYFNTNSFKSSTAVDF